MSRMEWLCFTGSGGVGVLRLDFAMVLLWVVSGK